MCNCNMNMPEVLKLLPIKCSVSAPPPTFKLTSLSTTCQKKEINSCPEICYHQKHSM